MGLDVGVELLGTCFPTECRLKSSARSRSTDSILKVVSARSGFSSPSMMMTSLSVFNHSSFKESPSRIASRTCFNTPELSASMMVDSSAESAGPGEGVRRVNANLKRGSIRRESCV